MSGRTRKNAETSVRYEWERTIRVLDMPSTTKHVALALATYADGNGTNAHPGEPRLAADCGYKPRAIRNHLAYLRDDLQLVERTHRGGANQYRREADVYALRLPENLLERVSLTTDYPGLGGVVLPAWLCR